MERQIELLSCLLDNIDANLKMLNDMTTAFYAQDLEALKTVMDRKFDGVCDATPGENAVLIYNRNIDWVAKMKTIMSSASTFFAVGAGHLPGEKGLIALLRNVGYKVEGVK